MTSLLNSPYVLAVSPASVRIVAGDHYAGHVSVRDNGTKPLHVSMSVMRLDAHACTIGHSAPPWLTLDSYQRFTLAPGQAHSVGYTVSAPSGETGQAAVIATGAPFAGKGNVHVSGAVGTRIVLHSTQQTCIAPRSAPVSHSTGLPGYLLAVIAVAALGLALLVLRTRVRHHHQNGSH